MKLIIFGLGSIGKRHARIILGGFPGVELAAFRTGLGGPSNISGLKEIGSWEEAERFGADAAIISNPTNLHIETAYRCAGMGMHLFIEKPIGNSTEGLDRLIEKTREMKLSTYVAYCLRFHPVIKALREELSHSKALHANIRATSYLPDWRKGRNHLEAYSVSASAGGGAILDLSHEFDYAEFLFGPITSIMGRAGSTGSVTIDAEDWADAIVAHEGGTTSNLHISFMCRNAARVIEVETGGVSICADILGGVIAKTGPNGPDKITVKHDMDEVYAEQMRYFLGNIGKRPMMNNLEEASALFRKIMEFKRSAFYA